MDQETQTRTDDVLVKIGSERARRKLDGLYRETPIQLRPQR